MKQSLEKSLTQNKMQISGFHSELKGLGFIVWDLGDVHSLGVD